MTQKFIILLMLAAVSADLAAAGHKLPVAREGTLDLRGTANLQETLVTLNGEWEFYWSKLLTPEDLQDPGIPQEGMLIHLPSYWSGYEINGATLPGFGYGTYALTVLLPRSFDTTLCFDIPIFDCAYIFYINDLIVSSNGTVGTSRESEEPWYRPASFCYHPRTDTLRLLVQVSNFHHRRGGFWHTMSMGGSQKIMDQIEQQKMFYYSTIGVLFLFLLFYLIFWIISRRDTIMLLFALTVLGILIRTIHTGYFLSNMFVQVPWSWQIRMEYLGTYLAHIFGMIFLHRMFHRDYMKPVIRINMIIFSVAILSVLVLPVRQFSYGMLLFQPVIVLFLVHYLVISFAGMLRRSLVDIIFFVSLVFFFLTLVNDILLANTAGAEVSRYLTPVSFQLLILAMAVMIIFQWATNYKQRIQLESSLRFKNKVLSMIAHDLKSPIASIAQFTDLLIAKPELTSRQKILDSLKESSRGAINLLENLLFWSRGQAEEMTLTLEEFELGTLVEEVRSLLSPMLDQKAQEFRVNVPQGFTVYADRQLMNTVLRNLVSNAIKFTPGGGIISVKAAVENHHARISVTDTGVGMEPGIITRFEKEGKIPSSSGTNRESGTGLGLQLVRDLVTKHGETLHIESTPGKGSVFSFTLPVKQGEKSQNEVNTEREKV